MASPPYLKDVLKHIVAGIVRPHVNTAVEEIAAAMADEIEAMAQDRVADLRAHLENALVERADAEHDVANSRMKSTPQTHRRRWTQNLENNAQVTAAGRRLPGEVSETE